MNLDQLYQVALLLKDGSVIMVPRSRPNDDVWWRPVPPIRLRPGEGHGWGASYPMSRDVRKSLLLAHDEPASLHVLRRLGKVLGLNRPWGHSPDNLIELLEAMAVMERTRTCEPWRLPRCYWPKIARRPVWPPVAAIEA